jgi:hypothetical protein
MQSECGALIYAPELRIAHPGHSGGRDITPVIKEALDDVYTAIFMGLRTFAIYAHGAEEEALFFAEQIAAIRNSQICRISLDSPLQTVSLKGVAGEIETHLPYGALSIIAAALRRGDALLFEGDDDGVLAQLQSFFAASLSERNKETLCFFSPKVSDTFSPSSQAIVLFPFSPRQDDARLWPQALVGAKAISLDPETDWTEYMRLVYEKTEEIYHAAEMGTPPETLLHEDGHLVYAPLDLEVSIDSILSSRAEIEAAIQGHLRTLLDSTTGEKDLEEAIKILARKLENAPLLDLLARGAARLKAAAEVGDSGIKSPSLPASWIARATVGAAVNAYLGHPGIEGWLRAYDLAVSDELRGSERTRTLVSVLDELVVWNVQAALWDIAAGRTHFFFSGTSG